MFPIRDFLIACDFVPRIHNGNTGSHIFDPGCRHRAANQSSRSVAQPAAIRQAKLLFETSQLKTCTDVETTGPSLLTQDRLGAAGVSGLALGRGRYGDERRNGPPLFWIRRR